MRASVVVFVVGLTAATAPVYSQGKTYSPKNGVVSWKTVILGGGFRVNAVVPLHGDFAKFNRLEVVRAVSAIGPDVPLVVLDRLTQRLVVEFKGLGKFSDVSPIEAFDIVAPSPTDAGNQQLSFVGADPLDAPIRPSTDMSVFDRQRALASLPPPATLILKSEVIDYAPGNKFAQLLFLNIGNALITTRLTYFDKTTAVELGRSVVSSDSSSKVLPSIISPRSFLDGVTDGIVDQVTRRQVVAEQ